MNPDDCARLRLLAPAAAIGALDPDDAAFVRPHLALCHQPHGELRDSLAAAAVIGEAMSDPATPSAELRARVLRAACFDC
ncbi:MAG TPA: hypothetical protein VHP64_01105 [Candidatus Limnocylindria bacterium]|nr:hypothetical protein [Candidatus Limnocylindria bacterium]